MFLLLGFAPVQAQGAGRIVGRVVNGTRAAAATGSVSFPVNLFQMGASGPVSRTVQTDATGQFVLDGVDLSSQQPFFARVDYAGIKYFSDLFVPTQPTTTLTITIYESSPVPADLHVSQMHLILDLGEGTIQGAALYQVNNLTDRAFMLPLALPQGAAQASFQDPLDQFRSQLLPDGRVAMPVVPGGAQILIGFLIPAAPPEAQLQLALPYPVDALSLLVSQVNDVQITSPQLAPAQPFTTQGGTTYLQVSGRNFSAGTTVSAVISNLPGTEAPPLARNLLMGAAAVAALALLIWPLARTRGAAPASPEAADQRAARQVELVQAIAALDDADEGERIDPDEYAARRAELKAELVALMQGAPEAERRVNAETP